MSTETSERDYLSHLNPQQQLAVTQTEGPMLILAGAGSGKTRTITYKIAHLIDRELCQPEQILAVTFTNKAAEEMRNRVQSLLTRAPGAPLLCTFHSFGVRVLRRHADRIGYRRDFTICDREDQMRVLKTVYEELHFTDKELPVRQTLAAISRAKSRDWGPEEYSRLSKDFSSEQIGLAYSAYENFLKQSNAMDFDDLILLTVRLLKENPEVRDGYGEHYRYLLIDEYQDTNRPQYELIKNLTQVHQNITAVGDEDQSIYGFRGADIENILHFEADFPGATIVKLEQNYRSTQTILDAATSVVSNNLNRKGKALWTDEKAGHPIELFAALEARSEATYVSQKIYQHLNEGTNGIAVLYRTNFQSRQFEEALRRLDVPYKLIGGVSFYHRREVKDALAYLRVVINPGDNVSLMRIINRPTRGIGQMTLDQLHHEAQQKQATLWEALVKGLEDNIFSGRAHLALNRFFELISQCHPFLQLPLHLTLEKILEASGYMAHLSKEDSEETHNRILNLEELINLCRENSEQGYTLQEFLDHAALRSEADDYDESASVSLMTLHNAKGLEFPVVFLVGWEEGLFPHSRSVAEDDLEEERRLCYVGLTRAQKTIYLTYSLRRRFFGREAEEMNRPSRFIQEIPEHLLNLHTFAPPPGPESWESRPSHRPAKKTSGMKLPIRTYDSTKSVRGFLDELSHKKVASSGGLVSGARIVHDKFGHGTILQVQDTGDDLTVTVQFPRLGIKKLLQSYAKLKLV
ncbi:MAG: UvrD-helicase domain-containing protein [Acidobacteriota bacterium]|nr:UvrD-helicase domain-containing protein [Acidobacteriota bacterium]